jgi:16S rRNA (cytosine967-C5)-methyltransferase
VAQSTARGVALAALRIWRNQTVRADSVISNLLASVTLSATDRAFALELFYGVLRNITLLDFWTGCLRQSRLTADLRDIVRLGLYQLLPLRIAEHAAVYESVALAPPKFRGLINGILRSAARQQQALLAKAGSQPLSIRTSHPEFLIARWEKNFGTIAATALCQWDNQPPHLYSRINRLKIADPEFLQNYPEAEPLADGSEFFEFPTLPNEALTRGHCYIQDPSTAIACDLLDPRPGERILDACAAPGGKTGLIAQKVRNQAFIVACDRDRARIATMLQNFERLGVHIESIVQCDWTHDRGTAFAPGNEMFDRILIDAPCTNTGVMRRRVDLRWRLQPEEFSRMQKQQLAIVRAVIPLLKPDGVLVYSTCSLEPEENEQVVEQLLAEFPRLRLTERRYSRPFRDHFDGAFAAKLLAGGTHEREMLHPASAMES